MRREHLPRIALVAVAGAVVAPTALAWGLQHADVTSASLLLNMEAAVTVVLARLFFGEAIGRRVGAAVLLMVAGGIVLVLAGSHGAASATWGLAAVLLATLAWATDNALTRPLSDLDPMAVAGSPGRPFSAPCSRRPSRFRFARCSRSRRPEPRCSRAERWVTA